MRSKLAPSFDSSAFLRSHRWHKIGLGSVPKLLIQKTEIALDVGRTFKPAFLDTTPQVAGDLFRGPYKSCNLVIIVFPHFLNYARERNNAFIPTPSFHVIHVISEGPQTGIQTAQLPECTEFMDYVSGLSNVFRVLLD